MLQPDQSIIEVCHVVNDMDAALNYWINVIGAGPFFIGDMELTENQTYRGKPAEVSIQVAFGFSGGLLIELVKPLRAVPSIFSEVLDSRGPGFHHVMLRVDYDEGFKRLSDAGYEVASHGTLPSGERCTLFDTQRDSNGFVELMEMSPLIARQFGNMERAHLEWDGHTDPRRSLAAAFA
ncbi:MAG: methylmalonyl-CoA mutase [Verrucomicrobiaceae bacterium]|nr:methylmalonyl-CoA mutase [Verrucomicrobiaceae bacterium]